MNEIQTVKMIGRLPRLKNKNSYLILTEVKANDREIYYRLREFHDNNLEAYCGVRGDIVIFLPENENDPYTTMYPFITANMTKNHGEPDPMDKVVMVTK